MSDPSAAARRDLLATSAILAVVFVVSAAPSALRRLGPHPTVAECDALLGRYVEQVVRAKNPDVLPSEVDKALVDARERAAVSGEIARCSEDSSAEAVACAMRAGGADEAERCLQ